MGVDDCMLTLLNVVIKFMKIVRRPARTDRPLTYLMNVYTCVYIANCFVFICFLFHNTIALMHNLVEDEE